MSIYGGGAGAPNFHTVAEAAQSQNTEAVLEMLNQNCNVNAQDMDGNTALHWAAWFKLDSITSTLLERGCRPDLGNSSGESPVHWAAKSSNVQALDLLTRSDRGLLSHRDCDGFTPFIICAQNDNAAVMEWMYLKGISVEEQDDWGRTALQWACYKGHRRSVQWLLSRSANVAHRDHEGMTAIHWAALKGHEQVAEMLVDVGAVQLLDVPDAAGDTPIGLAKRKKNRYLVMCFYKCQLLYQLIGRPHLSHNNFANLFVAFISWNVCVFAFIIVPGILQNHAFVAFGWSLSILVSLGLWLQACLADPGWLSAQTIFPQHRRIGADPVANFDARQPVESQMVFNVGGGNPDLDGCSGGGELARLETEQNKFNYQRQLIQEARRRLDSGCANDRASSAYATAGTGETELQPLMNAMDLGVDSAMPSIAQQAQLERASFKLRERERATGEVLGRERVSSLLSQGCGEYVSMLDRGEFKQVCVVCRAKREMRSHHCKECGRCVRRLDHHCPWIDNCVGLGNQRMFFCFIVALLATILSFYYTVWLYAVESVIPAIGSAETALLSITKWRIGPELGPLIVLVTTAFDLIWLAFVGALVARQSAYMCVNVTTYEVLVRPVHMQRRFPRCRGKLWFLQGCTPARCARNFVAFWTQDSSYDDGDFLAQPLAAMDSFVATPTEASAARRTDHAPSAPGSAVAGVPVQGYHLLPSNGVQVAPEQQKPPGHAPAREFVVPGGPPLLGPPMQTPLAYGQVHPPVVYR